MPKKLKWQPKKECECASDRSPGLISETKTKRLRIVEAPRIYGARRPVKGEVVTLIDVRFDSSGIELTEAWSRAICREEIHELMTVHVDEPYGDDADAIAFFEVNQGGNLVIGDEVNVDGEVLGCLAGFDYGHMPNHMNLVIERTGNPPIRLGSAIEFIPKGGSLNKIEDKLDCC